MAILRVLLLAVAALGGTAGAAASRPISWPGGLMLMLMHDDHMTGATGLYTFDRSTAVGLHVERHRRDGRPNGDWQFAGLTLNHLVQRWNFPDAQANVYVSGGFGAVHGEDLSGRGREEPGGFAGLIADIEDRRFLAAYEARYFHASGIESAFTQQVRLGVAPYIGGYGDLHTWIILQANHRPEAEDPASVALVLRMFQGNTLGELGVDDDGDLLFNLTLQF